MIPCDFPVYNVLLLRMADGGWRMADGGWRMTDGGWRMADGGWRMADGGWRMADGGWRIRKMRMTKRISENEDGKMRTTMCG